MLELSNATSALLSQGALALPIHVFLVTTHMMTSANGIKIVLSHLNAAQAGAMPGLAAIVTPQLSLNLPPKMVVGAYSGERDRSFRPS
jgi:hypothetical protein